MQKNGSNGSRKENGVHLGQYLTNQACFIHSRHFRDQVRTKWLIELKLTVTFFIFNRPLRSCIGCRQVAMLSEKGGMVKKTATKLCDLMNNLITYIHVTAVSLVRNPQLGGLLVELGMEGAFSGHAEYHFVILFVKERKRLSHSFGCFS